MNVNRAALLSILALAILMASYTPFTLGAPEGLAVEPLLGRSYIMVARNEIGPAELNLLSRYGTVSSVIGRVAAIEVSETKAIEYLKNLGFVGLLRKPREYRLNLDLSVPDIGASARWNLTLPEGGFNDGRGIIVGILDTGIDWRHPDFYFPDGRSKVLAIWDMTVSGRPPAGFHYGHECVRLDIVLNNCPSADTFGHGTGVAAVAASSGMALGKYKGVAPGAYIVAVKAGRPICGGQSWTFTDKEILDGMRYLLDKARELGMRIVINFSFGGQYGGHDGTDPLEIAIDDATRREGAIFAVAAGNDGDEPIHVVLSPGPREAVTLGFTPGGKSGGFGVTLWFGKGGKYEVGLSTPFKETIVGPTPAEGLKVKGGTASITFASEAKGDRWAVEFRSEDPAKSLPEEGWGLAVKAIQPPTDLTVHGWLSSLNCDFQRREGFRPGAGYKIDYSYTVGIPATSEKAIAVGAYVTRLGWVSIEGFIRGYVGVGEVGGLAAFSSKGPSRDGRLKPEITAPGVGIIAAGRMGRALGAVDITQYHRVWAGTSFSAPHAAGAIALILQANPSLGRDEVLAMLARDARQDKFTGPIPSAGSGSWGYGKLSALAGTGFGRALIKAEGLPAGATLSVEADGRRFGMRSEEALAIAVKKGSSVAVMAQQLVETADTRFTVKEKGPVVIGADQDFTFAYVAFEYYLRVTTEYGKAEGEGWYKPGGLATVRILEAVIQLSPDVRVKFVRWTGAISSNETAVLVKMDGPKELMAIWVKQYLVSIVSPYGAPSGGGWYDEGAEAEISIEQVFDHGNATRRVFVAWAGDVSSNAARLRFKVDGPKRILALWKAQHRVDLRDKYGKASGGGWYDAGALATISVAELEVPLGFLSKAVFKGWAGDIASNAPTVSFTVDRPMLIEAVWEVEFSMLYVVAGVALVAIIAAIVVYLRRRRGLSGSQGLTHGPL